MGGAAIFPVQRISGLTKQSSPSSTPLRACCDRWYKTESKIIESSFIPLEPSLAKGVTLGKSEQERTDWNQFGRRPNAKKSSHMTVGNSRAHKRGLDRKFRRGGVNHRILAKSRLSNLMAISPHFLPRKSSRKRASLSQI